MDQSYFLQLHQEARSLKMSLYHNNETKIPQLKVWLCDISADAIGVK